MLDEKNATELITNLGEVAAILSGLYLIVKKTIEVFFNRLNTRMQFNEQERQRIEKAKNDSQIKLIRLEAGTSTNELIKDFNFRLTSLQQKYNALRVSILIYHNGVAEYFKNYSMRHQVCRNVLDMNKQMHQNQPLNTAYSMVMDNIEKGLIAYDKEYNNSELAYYLEYNKIKVLVSCAIMIPLDKVPFKVPEFQTDFYKDGALCIGMVHIELDEKSTYVLEELTGFTFSFTDAVEQMYMDNPYILN